MVKAEMVNWALEWSEVDSEQCWIELIAIWNYPGFKGHLLQGAGLAAVARK